MGVKNTNSTILKPMMHLKCCNFINGLPEWVSKENHAEIVLFESYFGVRSSLWRKKGKNMAKFGAKIQNRQF